MDSQFEAWCEKPLQVHCDWAVVPCPVHVAPACEEQVRASFPDGGGPDFIRVAALYHAELVVEYHIGQVCHALAEPLRGKWYVLWHLGMLYIDALPLFL